MKKTNKLKFLAILGLSVLLIGCHEKKKEENGIVRPVKIMDLSEEHSNGAANFPGMVVAKDDTILAFKFPGTISKINVVAGDYVKKGQVIASLDTKDYEVNLKANKEKYLAAKASFENMKKQYKRAQVLHDGKAMSDKNFDIVTAQYKATSAICQANLEGYKNAKNKLKDTNIYAPYDGYIGKKLLDKGSVVSAATPVVSIVSTGTQRVEVNIAGKDMEKFKKSQTFTFKPGDSNEIYNLKLLKIGKSTDLLKLTYPVTLEFTDKNSDKLISGTTGEVKIDIKDKESEEITIPITAVFDKNGSSVYLFKDGKAVLQKVELGNLKANGEIAVISGLTKEDKIITAGVHTVEDGQEVRVLPKSSPTNIGNIL